MKIIISEDKTKKAIYQSFNKMVKKGLLPSIKPFLDLFDVKYRDIDSYYNLIMDYNGGFDNSVNLAKKLLLGLKDIPFKSRIGRGTLYFTVKSVVLNRHNLDVEVDCYGELFNMVIYNEEEDQNEVVNRISLGDYYDLWDDIGESAEVKEIIKSDIEDVLIEEITYKTGIDIFIDYVYITKNNN